MPLTGLQAAKRPIGLTKDTSCHRVAHMAGNKVILDHGVLMSMQSLVLMIMPLRPKADVTADNSESDMSDVTGEERAPRDDDKWVRLDDRDIVAHTARRYSDAFGRFPSTRVYSWMRTRSGMRGRKEGFGVSAKRLDNAMTDGKMEWGWSMKTNCLKPEDMVGRKGLHGLCTAGRQGHVHFIWRGDRLRTRTTSQSSSQDDILPNEEPHAGKRPMSSSTRLSVWAARGTSTSQ